MRKNYKKQILGFLAAGMILMTLNACGEQKQTDATAKKQTEVGFYLDTVITLTAYTDDSEVLKNALEECGRYEEMLSRTIEGSDIWRINHASGEPVTVSEDTIIILKEAIRISEMSDGAFDITIAPVTDLWDFRTGNGTVPEGAAVSAAVMKVDYRQIHIEGNTVTLPAGMMIDLGGIAKGYIADRIGEYLTEQGITSAVLSFGGNVVTIGRKPDGSVWRIGIQDIDAPTGTSMMVTKSSGGSTVTSGIYERGFEQDGIWYHHILSTETGWPIQNELASVTVFSESSMTGDALSTAVFAMGTEEGVRLIDSMDGIEAILITRDRKVIYTNGAEDYILK